jgi:hypothetical protein
MRIIVCHGCNVESNPLLNAYRMRVQLLRRVQLLGLVRYLLSTFSLSDVESEVACTI